MKERLTGAIILVALLVLLVPELLTGPESKSASNPAGAEGAQLRSYTIDLKDDATRQPPPPQAPVTAASDEPVGQATPEADAGSPPATQVIPPVDDAARAAGKPMGSGADATAAAPDQPAQMGGAAAPAAVAEANPKAGAGTSPSAADETPRSAFGPNARPQPEKSSSAAKPGAGASDASRASAAKADAARLAAAKAESAKAEAARVAAAKADNAKSPSISKPDAKAPGSKGWAVQLGVFGSRDNAERLAKQVKGNGFPVVINETSGKDGKKLYWVRVGPEAEQASATALSAKLKAAGHRDARVVAYP